MIIANNSEYQIALALIESFMKKGFGSLSAEETENLKQFSVTVKSFEKFEFPMPLSVIG